MEPSREAAAAGRVMTLQNAPQVFGDIERLKTKQQNGGLTKDEQINLHHAENLLARAQVTNLEAKQKALSQLATPRDLHSTELEALAKAKAMLARPWPGTAPKPEPQTATAATTQSSSGPLPPGDTSTTHGVTPPTGTATSSQAGTGNTTGSTTSTASSGDTPAPGSGTHTTNGVTAPPVGHGNRIPEDTTHPEHIDLANKRVENLGKIAAKRKLDPHEQDIYDNALRVRDRNTPAQPGNRNTGNPDDLAMAGDEDALLPVTPDGEDAHLDAAADAPPPAAPAQPANAIGSTINGPSTANPDAPTSSAGPPASLPLGSNSPQNNSTPALAPLAPESPTKDENSRQSKSGSGKASNPSSQPGQQPLEGPPRPIMPPIFNRTHHASQPKPKGIGPNEGGLESHHGIQQEWALHNLKGYKKGRAPTLTLENGSGLPHSIISARQRKRRNERAAKLQEARNMGLEVDEKSLWNYSVEEELSNMVGDLTAAGYGKVRWTPKFGPVVKLCDYGGFGLG